MPKPKPSWSPSNPGSDLFMLTLDVPYSLITKSCPNGKLWYTVNMCTWEMKNYSIYCRTHNFRVCLYIAYIACGSASLYIKTLYFLICTFCMLAVATVANIKIRYDVKTPQFAIFGTCVICVFHSIQLFNVWFYS